MASMPQYQEIIYPESDGKPMADNTKQFVWIVTVEAGLDSLFANNPDVFVAGNLLWYPVEGHPEICAAPDAMVVFGRPKGHRGSYRQWKEGNLPPQVVFEILSPGNDALEMDLKRGFYERYGVEEYYVYDPDKVSLTGWIRLGKRLEPIAQMKGWTSPLLNITFRIELDGSVEELRIYDPDGRPFATSRKVIRQRNQAEQRAEQAEQERQEAEQRAAQAEQRADQERQERQEAEQRADQERQRTEQLLALLKAKGIELGDL